MKKPAFLFVLAALSGIGCGASHPASKTASTQVSAESESASADAVSRPSSLPAASTQEPNSSQPSTTISRQTRATAEVIAENLAKFPRTRVDLTHEIGLGRERPTGVAASLLRGGGGDGGSPVCPSVEGIAFTSQNLTVASTIAFGPPVYICAGPAVTQLELEWPDGRNSALAIENWGRPGFPQRGVRLLPEVGFQVGDYTIRGVVGEQRVDELKLTLRSIPGILKLSTVGTERIDVVVFGSQDTASTTLAVFRASSTTSETGTKPGVGGRVIVGKRKDYVSSFPIVVDRDGNGIAELTQLSVLKNECVVLLPAASASGDYNVYNADPHDLDLGVCEKYR